MWLKFLMSFGSHCSHSIISIFQFRNITDLQVRRSGTMITLNARSNEKKLTIMAMVLILVFVICNSFYTIYFPLKYGKVILYKSQKELNISISSRYKWVGILITHRVVTLKKKSFHKTISLSIHFWLFC